MAGHPVDRGDTLRHFDAGADVVIGLGQAKLKVTRDVGDLDAALIDLQAEGMDFAVVEGFKTSLLPKIVMADIDVPNALKRVDISDLDEEMVGEIVKMVLELEDFRSNPKEPEKSGRN
jgi:molybdopterin synthase catalytic subunit